MSEPSVAATGVTLSTRELRVVWGDIEALPPTAVNQFFVQIAGFQGNNLPELIVTFGYLAPPFVQGTQAEQEALIQENPQVHVAPSARMVMQRGTAEQLVAILQSALAAWPQQSAQDQARGQ